MNKKENFIISLFNEVRTYFQFYAQKISNILSREKLSSLVEPLLLGYELALNYIARISVITVNFIKSLTRLLPNVTILSNLKYLFSILATLAMYSKIVLVYSPLLKPYIPLPTLSLVTDYWDCCILLTSEVIALVSGFIVFSKGIIEEYQQQSTLLESTSTELQSLRSAHSEQKTQLDNMYNNSIPKEVFEKELLRWQTETSELVSESRITQKANEKLSLQNDELFKDIRLTKTMTSLEKAQSAASVIGNIALIGVQVVNAYNSFGTATPSNNAEIKLLIASVNQLLSQRNMDSVRRTADQRAAQSTSNSGPSEGLTSSSVNFNDEFI